MKQGQSTSAETIAAETTSTGAHLLERSPALSWRMLPAGIYVHDQASGGSYFLDSLGSAIFNQAWHPIDRAVLLNSVESAAGASDVLAGMLATGILVKTGTRPIRAAEHCAHPGDALLDGLVASNSIRNERPFSVAVEWPRHPEPGSRQETTSAERVRLLEQLAHLGAVSLEVLGEGVLARPDALFLLREARQQGFSVSVFTDGSGINESVAAELAGLYLEELWITLHGGDAETHDRVTGVPGSFDQALGAIRALQHHGQPVTINGLSPTPAPRHREGLRELAHELGCGLVMDPFHFPEESESEKDAETIQSPVRPSLMIMSDGSVRPCRAFAPIEENVTEHSITEIWESSTILRAAAKLPLHRRTGCRACLMRTACFGGEPCIP